MCTSYCSGCSYCVSNCTCTNTTTVPPCTSRVGCTSTNYVDCNFWRGGNISTSNLTITDGDNLEDIILSIKTALDGITPADQAWNTFDYACLGSYTTAQEFAEGVSAAVCALSAGTGILIPGTVLIPPGAPGDIGDLIPGTSTTEDSWNATFGEITNIYDFLTTGSVNTSCAAGVWSTVPSSPTMKGWVNWIKSNVCSLVKGVQDRATDLETFQSDVSTFAGTLDAFDNTDCLGGSGSDDLQTTIGLIKNKLCSVDSTVSALPNLSSISLPWTTCGGSIGGSWAGYTNSASLTTQLSRIVTQLALRTFSFSGDFDVTETACGTSVSLSTVVTPFSCSDLGTCSIHNLGDVDSTTLGTSSGDKFKVLSWSTASSKWYPKTLSFTSSDGTINVATKTDNGSSLVYDLTSVLVDGGNSSDTGLVSPVDLEISAASGGSRTLTLKYNPNYFSTSLGLTFTPAPSLAASGYTSDTSTAYRKGGVVYLGGAYTIAMAAPIATGTFYTIGAISASGIPSGGNRVISTFIVDEATDIPYSVLLQIDSSGNIQIRNVTGASLGIASYTIHLTGISYLP